MKVHEYQAKRVIAEFGAPVPKGYVAATREEAFGLYDRFEDGVCVVKAQIHAGGRGKGGGVKVCRNGNEFRQAVDSILGMNLVTPQTGAEGQKVKTILVEEGKNIAKELYFSILVDRNRLKPVLIASREGGMDIETVAARTPEKILYEFVDPLVGLRPFQSLRLAYRLGLHEYDKSLPRKASGFFAGLYRAFMEKDASLLEINPMIVTAESEIVALDCKMNFDDNALFKQKFLEQLRDLDEENEAEIEASRHDLNFIKLDGTIGCMVNGAGLAMATMDIVKHSGGSPANFLDVGGNTTQEKVEAAINIITRDPSVKSILVNIFGGIVRCDMIAKAVVNAVRSTGISIPLVVRLRGNRSEEALEIIDRSGLGDALTLENDLARAALLAVRSAA